MHTSRTWVALTGKKSARAIVLTFRLAHKGRVVFTLFEVSPLCRTAARFAVVGQAGVNRVRFNGRVHGRTLQPGTYQLRAHKVGSGTVLHVTLVIAATPPSASYLTQARASNVCGATGALPTPFGNGQLAAATIAGGANSPASEIVRNQNPSPASSASRSGTPTAAAPFLPGRVSKNAANPLVIATLGLAMLLLGLAALPQAAVPDARLSYLLARHRIEVALAGAAALAAALLALALA